MLPFAHDNVWEMTMADKVSLENIKKARELIDEVLAEMQTTKDAARLQTLSTRMGQLGARLERLAVTYEAQQAALLPPEARVSETLVTVVLTEEQRTLVLADTGLSLTEIQLRAHDDRWLRTLPGARPRELNNAILRAARRVAGEREARRIAERKLAELEAISDPQLKKQLHKARQDPNFMGGLLNRHSNTDD